MKKTLLSVLVSSVLVLSACDDSTLTQKVLEAEKKIVRLENDLKKSQADLTAKENELTALKTAQRNDFSGLKVDITTLYHKTEKIKHPKSEESGSDETDIELMITAPVTHIEWLDKLLLDETMKTYTGEEQKSPVTKEAITQKSDELFQEYIASAKEFRPFGLKLMVTSFYLGQRHNIVSFTQTYYDYGGGAHGNYATRYLNIDTDKKAVIRLDDLIAPKNRQKLQDMLWENYAESRVDENGKYNGYAQKEDFVISPNFYFSGENIIFVYSPYVLGPYAEGEVEIRMSRYLVNELLNPEYQYKQSDGFIPQQD
ncbi:DUF3298 domain-containing protein [Glaesserella sp.]|uniref:DUF3298 and DUF4163 domain-containing protein n=1 Tax=Glaesserella sp. TaxID=2094731 RepID=UPI0035A0364C